MMVVVRDAWGNESLSTEWREHRDIGERDERD